MGKHVEVESIPDEYATGTTTSAELRRCRRQSGQRGKSHAKPCPHPTPNVPDKECLVRREPFGIETGRVLLKSEGLVGQSVNVDHHRARSLTTKIFAPCDQPLIGRGVRPVGGHVSAFRGHDARLSPVRHCPDVARVRPGADSPRVGARPN